ncbi:hypothetical protein TrRE_jg6025 [Triparma retinervis]|uniref:Uncharacterized protein n=1 Tax=Triparma retinervis TaxID=2557542 RepID=A0A9W6Z8X5_9STRA|nr:hypothetical protein TrRE_jg6025 [Triparma retinervis]
MIRTTYTSASKLSNTTSKWWEESDASDSDYDDDDMDDFDFKAERAKVLEIARQQREVARWYLHPEDPVPSSLGARCFFDRASSDITYLNEVDETAPKGIVDVETADEMQERDECLAAAAEMKETVSWYLHPERPVITSGNTARCYFGRASSDITYLNEVDETAPKGIVDVETADEMQERAECLAAAAEMKETVSWYHHPSTPLKVDPVSSGRNYFGRASAPEQMSVEDADDMAECLAAATEMKERISWYHHPSTPLKVDPVSSGRNYFGRASAPEQMEDDDADDMAECLEAAREMKEKVSWYLHPERPVTTNGNTARCFFDRASAPEQMSVEDADDMAECLAAAATMKETVSWFHHPSTPLKVDPASSARNYFQPNASQISTRRLRGESIMDQFEMEGLGGHTSCQDALRASLGAVAIDTSGSIDPSEEGSSEKEGNLSRSPSSVMLFEQAA